jgi:hypothetical protein
LELGERSRDIRVFLHAAYEHVGVKCKHYVQFSVTGGGRRWSWKNWVEDNKFAKEGEKFGDEGGRGWAKFIEAAIVGHTYKLDFVLEILTTKPL